MEVLVVAIIIIIPALVLFGARFWVPLIGFAYLAWPWVWKYFLVGLVLGYFSSIIYKRLNPKNDDMGYIFLFFLLGWPVALLSCVVYLFVVLHDKLSEPNPERISSDQVKENDLERLNKILVRIEDTDLEELADNIVKELGDFEYENRSLIIGPQRSIEGKIKIVHKHLKELTDV